MDKGPPILEDDKKGQANTKGGRNEWKNRKEIHKQESVECLVSSVEFKVSLLGYLSLLSLLSLLSYLGLLFILPLFQYSIIPGFVLLTR